MDTKVRSLLTAVQKYGPSEPSLGLLQQAFDLLRNVAETQTGAVDSPDTLAQDLYVICAESAFQHGLQDMAKECLKMYFMKQPPANQFLCRAYLCQAQLLAPSTAESPDQLEKAVVYLIKAISMAKENTRYNFLVYNASVLYWQFCRPFLKPNFRQYLARSLHQVVKALDDIDDKDYEWRAQLMLALIECHMDAGRKQDATHIAQAAASFIKQHVPSLYKTVFGYMIRYQLVDTQSQKMQKDIRTSADLNIYYRICRLKLTIEEKDTEKDASEEMKKILQLLQGLEEPKPEGAKSSKGGRRSTTPDDKKSTSRSNTSLNLSGRFSPVPAPTRKLAANSNERPHLLLELGRLASEQNLIEIAQSCLDMLKDNMHLIQDPSFLVEVEFLQCELMVKGLGNKQESYQKAVIDIRQQAIRRCDEAILSAIRSGNPGVIQAGCVTQWNLCLPLLQPNLRKHVRRPLTQVADALEEIQSLLIQLRCQVHMEVAKCEEDQEQIEVAIKHLHKAQTLDDGSVYKERLDVALHRLELRATLYSLPERPEDQAAMIIEQARKANSGTMRMKRGLLVRAGEALAPDAFLLVLESENDTKEVTSGKGVSNAIAKLAGKAQRFNRSVKKAAGHLKRLGDENDKERSQLWGDLAKTARKQEVWDVCRIAARFCLLYDDGRWKNEPPKSIVPSRQDRGKDLNASQTHVTIDNRAETFKEKSSVGDHSSRPSTPEPTVPLREKDLIRMLADVNFINGEALIHLLRSEGVELGDEPVPPVDKSKKPKGYVAKKPEEDEDWIEYREWIHTLKKDAESSFLRGAALGVELEEPWIVCSAAAYTWNYYNHVLQQNRHKEIVEPLQTLLDAFKKIGHAGETVLLVNICNALSIGIIQPWVPETPKDALIPSPPPGANKSPRGSPSRRAQMTSKPSKSIIPISVSPDATPDLKKGIEVCEFIIKVTNGENKIDVVPIATRMLLLQTWVRIKQMLQAQINKTFGVDDENNTEGQNSMTRAIVAVEMLSLNYNGIMEFKELPSLNNAANMIESCNWSDKLVELQLWTRLAFQAYELKQHDAVTRCAKMALEIGEKGTQIKGRKMDGHHYIVEQEMLCYASVLYGQSLMDNAQGNNSIRRQAIEQFLNSARFACEAQNAEMVVTAGRHYWNAIIPLIGQPIERELLREPITILLDCINETTDKKLYDKKHDESDDEEDATDGIKPLEAAASGNKVEESQGSAPPMGAIGGPDDDLTLRASLYGVLFQSYADKGQWEEGLMAMDQAVKDMPRTNHRLLIFKHMVMTKAKLGQNVQMSIQKFKDGSEDYVAHMWRKVALCSTEQLEQLQAYQNAIETLVSEETQWQKFEYLLEFAQWLYCNEFPIQDTLDQVQWAVDILLNMQKPEEAQRKEQTAGATKKKAKQKEKRGKSPPAAAKPKGGAKPQKPSKTTSKASKDDKNKSEKAKQRRESSPDKEPKKSIDGTNESGEITAVEYIPVYKEVIIGLLPGNPDLKINDLTDVRQLEGLFRAHVMMAQLAGQGAVEFSHYCLMAYRFIMAMWQVSLSQAGPVAKEIAKQPPPEPSKGSAKGKAKKEKEVVKEKPKRKHPVDHVPVNTEEWSVYDAPDEALEAFKHGSMKTYGINSGNISKPMLTIILLEKLVTYLRQMGYSQMSLPILALADVISKDILKNEPLMTLIHLRAVEVCVELNLPDGISFHEKLSMFKLNEDQQARSREEMTAWAEKQLQVIREERRLRQSMSKFSVSGKTVSRQKLTAKQKPKQENTQGGEGNLPVVQHLGRVVGSVNLRDVWTDAAQLLVKQGLYQPAREMLREALLASESFNDPALTGRVLYILGTLSYLEAQYKQAINFCAEAQRTFNGDEMFWYETTMLMIEATLKDYTMKSRFRQARGMLVQAVNVFSDIAERRPNKASITGYILAMFEAKLGAVQILLTKEEHDDLTKPKVINGFLSALKKVRNGYHKLVRLGYNREALPLYKEHADILCNMARTALTPAEKHEFYIQALEVYTEACNLCDLINQDVSTTTTLQDLRNVSLPCQRECAEMHTLSCDLQLEIFELHMKEERNVQLQNLRKPSVVRAVEEITCETPVYTDTEQRWVDTVKVVAENVLVELAAVHNLVGPLPHLKSKALYLNGRCLRLLSQHKNPDQPMQWQLQDMAILQMKDHSEVNADQQQVEENTELEVEQKSRPTSSKYTQLIQKLKAQMNVSHSYLVEATECLQQALNLALNNDNKEVAGLASLELAECVGQFDPGLTSQYLALHQSCTASKYLEELMFKALVDPTTSQQAALFHQQRALLAEDVTSNASRGPTIKSIHDTLTEHSVAWQRLMISSSHMDLLKDLPPNFNIVILQHNPDRSCLYGAVLDKPKNVHVGKQAKGAVQQTMSKAKVVRVEKDPKELDTLLSRYKWFKHDVMQMLLKQEYQRSQQAQREKMLANLEDASKPPDNIQNETASEVSDEEKLEAEFKSLLEAVEQYMQPITSQLDQMFRPSSASTTTGNPKKGAGGAEKEKDASHEYMVLLADPHLMRLPLEALHVLQTENLTSITRDVSLQMLHHKVHQQVLDDVAEKAKKEKEKTKPPSRIPGLRDASKKMSKIIPLDRPVPQGCLPLDTHTFRFVVDPNLDCSETETKAPIECFNKMLEEHEQQFTPRWLGVAGNDHVPSIGEYETYINESSGFIFYGMERFLSNLPPFKVAALNLVDTCQLMMLFDLAQTNSSFLRQSKVDVFKTADALSLEKPVDTVLLLSLTGVRSVCSNQWHCTLTENAERLDATMKDLLARGQTIGQAVRLLFAPYLRPKPEVEGEEDQQEGADESKPPAEDQVEAPEEDDKISATRSWYNMVCYGAPNLMVTQLSKP